MKSITEQQKIIDAATPGPWGSSREDMDSFAHNEDHEMVSVAYVYRDPEDRIPVFGGQFRHDSRFIAHSRTAYPELLAWAKRARPWLLHLESILAGIRPGEPYYQGAMDTRTSGLSVLIRELPE